MNKSMKAGGSTSTGSVTRQEAGGRFLELAQTPTRNFSGVHWGGLYRLWFGQKSKL
jgi:hypothetical protein